MRLLFRVSDLGIVSGLGKCHGSWNKEPSKCTCPEARRSLSAGLCQLRSRTGTVRTLVRTLVQVGAIATWNVRVVIRTCTALVWCLISCMSVCCWDIFVHVVLLRLCLPH